MLFTDAGLLSAGLRFPALSKPENQIDDKSDKRQRGDNPPLGLFARCAEILLGHIDDGPDGGNKKRDT